MLVIAQFCSSLYPIHHYFVRPRLIDPAIKTQQLGHEWSAKSLHISPTVSYL